MSVDKARRVDWVVGGLALLLVADLLALPWYSVGGSVVSGITLRAVSETATGWPSAFLGVLAVVATLGVLIDLVLERLSPDTPIPAIHGDRAMTRHVLAVVSATLLALKFVLHLGVLGNLGVGFWLGAALTGALVYATMRARRAEPPPAKDRRHEPADVPPRDGS